MEESDQDDRPPEEQPQTFDEKNVDVLSEQEVQRIARQVLGERLRKKSRSKFNGRP